jgi:hypothetical protein
MSSPNKAKVYRTSGRDEATPSRISAKKPEEAQKIKRVLMTGACLSAKA